MYIYLYISRMYIYIYIYIYIYVGYIIHSTSFYYLHPLHPSLLLSRWSTEGSAFVGLRGGEGSGGWLRRCQRWGWGGWQRWLRYWNTFGYRSIHPDPTSIHPLSIQIHMEKIIVFRTLASFNENTSPIFRWFVMWIIWKIRTIPPVSNDGSLRFIMIPVKGIQSKTLPHPIRMVNKLGRLWKSMYVVVLCMCYLLTFTMDFF